MVLYAHCIRRDGEFLDVVLLATKSLGLSNNQWGGDVTMKQSRLEVSEGAATPECR